MHTNEREEESESNRENVESETSREKNAGEKGWRRGRRIRERIAERKGDIQWMSERKRENVNRRGESDRWKREKWRERKREVAIHTISKSPVTKTRESEKISPYGSRLSPIHPTYNLFTLSLNFSLISLLTEKDIEHEKEKPINRLVR